MHITQVVNAIHQKESVMRLDLGPGSAASKDRLESLVDAHFQALCTAIAKFKYIQELDLRGNKFIKFTDIKFNDLFKAFAQCKIQVIRLDYSNLEDLYTNPSRYQTLCNIISGCGNLNFNLDWERLASYENLAFEALATFLYHCENLQKIYLWGTDLAGLNDERFLKICNIIDCHAKCLQEVDLGNNGLGSCDIYRIEALSNSIANCENLQTLKLYTNVLGELEEDCFQILCTNISKLNNLKRLYLRGNSLGAMNRTRVILLCKAITQCEILEELDLGDNNLREIKAKENFKIVFSKNQWFEPLQKDLNAILELFVLPIFFKFLTS